MKPQLTFTLLLFCLSLTAQVEFKVKLLPDNSTYQVLVRSNVTYSAPMNTVPGAQVTVRVPTGGFSVGNITNLAGQWQASPAVMAPPESPGYDYIIFGLNSPTSAIPFVQGVEVPVFNFSNAGSCTGPMELLDHNTDPFMPPNSLNVNVGNAISVIGAGIGVNAYSGNYSAISADCSPSSNCGIEIFDIILNSPSACGVADGSIEIVATTTGPFPLRYSINGGGSYFASPVFNNLAAGNEFEIIVTNQIFTCIVEAGIFELDGPLAAVVTAVDLNSPDCDMDNGSITVHATPNNGGVLEYGIGTPPVYQASPTFTNLAAGLYPLWVFDNVNNCENNFGTYLLEDCQPDPCVATYALEYLGNGRYQVNMTSGVTYNDPDNIVDSILVTLKVPTGGFNPVTLTSQVTNVDFELADIYTAPAESPDFDYITFALSTTGTQDIPMAEGASFPLFTFENDGNCSGDSISLMLDTDPFYPPNGSNALVGQYIKVAGAGASGIAACVDSMAVVECGTVPVDPDPCAFTYEIEKLPSGLFQVSLISEQTYAAPNNITTTIFVTVKVPTGGFAVGSLTSAFPSVPFNYNLVTSPVEDPDHDYIVFWMDTPFTSAISYNTGVKLPLFTFENAGSCQGSDIFLMDPTNDPFMPPNSANLNVDQTITVAGYGQPATACISNLPAEDCNTDPCAALAVAFSATDVCEGNVTNFTNTTTSIDAIISWNWDFGDNTDPSNEESPSHQYSTSGNFEVSLTVTTENGCESTFSDFVTVFSTPGVPAVTAYTDCGAGVQLSAPAADSILWSPSTGLSPSNNIPDPIAAPAQTTTYTVTLTTADGCQSSTDVTVFVDNKPVFKDVITNDGSDCGANDAFILVSAGGTGDLEFSLDNVNWQLDSIFTNLLPGDYNVFVRNANGACTVAYNGNPVTINAMLSPTIDDIALVNPTGCNSDGTITVTASGGNGPLQYSLVGIAGPQDNGTFTGLGEGLYQISVTNNDGSCEQTGQAFLTQAGGDLSIINPIDDFELCESTTGTISISVTEDIIAFDITGNGAFSNASFTGNTLTFDVDPSMGANNYNVEITGTSNCTIADAFTVNGLSTPVSDFVASSTLCVNGEVTFSFTGTASANATVNWNIDGGQIQFQDNQNIVVVYDQPGDIQVTAIVNDNGCQDAVTKSFTISAFDPGAQITVVEPTCGNSDGELDLTLSGGGNYSFMWSGPGISGGEVTQEDQTGLPGGLYRVTITEDGSNCQTELETTITGSPLVSLSATSTDAVDCLSGAGTGSITVELNGGTGDFIYELYSVNDMNNAVAQGTSNLPVYIFNSLDAGAYVTRVTDLNGCTDETTLAVQAINSDVIASSTKTDADCGQSNGSLLIEIQAGQAPFTYDYFFNNIQQGINQPVNGTTVMLSNIGEGTGVVIVRDANGCIDPVSFSISTKEPNWNITENIVQPGCDGNDGSIELANLPNGSVVSWLDNTGNQYGAANPLNGIGAGVYTAIIIDPTGCTGERTVVVAPGNGPDINVVTAQSASCGNSDGSFTFTVNSNNSFNYDILGTGMSGFGTPGQEITITGVPAGVMLIEVTDLVNPDCQSFEAVMIGGSLSSSQMVAVATPPSDCGVEDATICLDINGGAAPYTITSSLGTPPAGTVMSSACITDLYEGQVIITIVDADNCSTEIPVNLPEVIEPNISIDKLDITHIVCPGEFGAILSNSGVEYEIFDASNTKVGETPWTSAPIGNYIVKQQIGNCEAEVSIEVTGPDAWDVVQTVANENCGNQDGSILLMVNGANGDYSYNWSNGDTTAMVTELSSGIYDVTITDKEGCSIELSDIEVGHECPSLPCDDIFTIDTFFVSLQGDRTEICLPTEYGDITIFDLYLDGSTYTGDISACNDALNYYNYNTVPNTPPYRLEKWTFRGQTQEPALVFDDFQVLVDYMNQQDPLGNWKLDRLLKTIYGGDPDASYQDLVINHTQTNISYYLGVNQSVVPTPSIFVNDELVHVFIAADPQDAACADTLYINLLDDNDPVATTDTIYVDVPVGLTEEVCVPMTGIPGTPEFMRNECASMTNNAQIISNGTECFDVMGLDVGPDYACIVICDDLGNCDTVHLVINVFDNSTDIEIYTGFSPNEDSRNDYFRIKNIELYPDNKLIVFNRWGNLVYSAEHYTNANPWKAVYKNTYLPDGTYFYMLEVNIGGKNKTYSGFVEVRR